jgi:phosphatidylethanolamine-binding protein (PEBP) family uncharacterized protein
LTPGPQKGTGLHRYVFALYQQNGKEKQDFSNVETIESSEVPSDATLDQILAAFQLYSNFEIKFVHFYILY